MVAECAIPPWRRRKVVTGQVRVEWHSAHEEHAFGTRAVTKRVDDQGNCNTTSHSCQLERVDGYNAYNSLLTTKLVLDDV